MNQGKCFFLLKNVSKANKKEFCINNEVHCLVLTSFYILPTVSFSNDGTRCASMMFMYSEMYEKGQ